MWTRFIKNFERYSATRAAIELRRVGYYKEANEILKQLK